MMKKFIINLGKTIIKINKVIKSENNNKKDENKKNYIKQESINRILNNQNNTHKEINIKRPIFIVLLISFIISSIILKKIIIVEILMIFTIMIIIYNIYPQIKVKQHEENVIKQLPFALRQISIELKAGIGLLDSINNIASSDYGELSDEFKITLEEIHYGTNYNIAFNNLIERNNKPLMKKTINQIIRTLNTGGNLSKTLNSLANENSHNIKIKYKEYSEKLNSIMLLYMFIAVLLPVILFIMIIAATTVIGPIIKPELLIILYLVFFPLIISFMILLIKKMEPNLI